MKIATTPVQLRVNESSHDDVVIKQHPADETTARLNEIEKDESFRE